MSSDEEFVKRFGAVFLDSYFVVDKDRHLLGFNQAFSQMLELRPSERRKLIGEHCYDKLRLEICKDRCIALEAIKKDSAVRMEEIRGTTAEGRELVLELSAIPLKDENGQTTSVFVTHRDVTDERRLKARYLDEQSDHRRERSSLLRIIEDREIELEDVRKARPKGQPSTERKMGA